MQDPSIRLRNAIVGGNISIVKRLLTRFPDLLTNIDTTNGWSNLHYASYHGQHSICYLLVALGHDANEISLTFKRQTPLHLSVIKSHIHILEFLLLKFSSAVDYKDENGQTPLHIASILGDYVSLEVLLMNRSSIDLQDNEGNTSLHLALKFGQLNCVKILTNHKANDTIRNNENWLPMDLAPSFDFQKQYETIKRTPINFIENISLYSNGSSRRSSESESPTKPISSNQFLLTHKNSVYLNNISQTSRQHSNSLPPLPPQKISRRFSSTSLKSPSTNNLSNYTLGYSVSNLSPRSNNNANEKASPTDGVFSIPSLPSIKSVNISPNKLKGNSNETPSSPVSTMSTRSFRTINSNTSVKKRSSSLSSSFNQYLSNTSHNQSQISNTPKIEESESESEMETDSIKSISTTNSSHKLNMLSKTQKILRHIRSTPTLNNFSSSQGQSHSSGSSKPNNGSNNTLSSTNKFNLHSFKSLMNLEVDVDDDEDEEDRKINIHSQTKILNIPISSFTRDHER